jgi:hypothetical protein
VNPLVPHWAFVEHATVPVVQRFAELTDEVITHGREAGL